MHPILFTIGPLTIYTYGFFSALALLTALWFVRRQSKIRNLPAEQVMNLFFYSIIAGIVGARLFYVLLYFPLFRDDPLEVFRLWNGGLVFYGGFLAGFAFVLVYVKRQKLPLGVIMDIIAVGMPLAHGIARIGCFFAGCCYGKACALPWAVVFTNPHTLARPDVPLHPTQLYSSAGNFMIFAILLMMSRKDRFAGRLIFFYLLFYGLFRSFVEIFRGDERGAPIFDFLSTSQTIGLTAAAFAAVCLIIFSIRDKNNADD